MYLYDDNGDKNWICTEFEVKDTHTIEDWEEKLKRAQKPDIEAGRPRGFDHIIFTGTGAVCKEMLKSKMLKEAGVVYPQGETLLNAIEKIRNMYSNRKPQNLSGIDTVIDPMGAY